MHKNSSADRSTVQRRCAVFCLILFGSATAVQAAEPFPRFVEQTIDPNIGKVCYAVTVADVNGDQAPDIVAVSENRVLWYQNPTWEPHVMITDQTPRDNVCIAPYDIDGDGQVDFAIGAGWTKIGTLHWINRGASLNDPWSVHSIGQELALHRARWANVLGRDRDQLVISPLTSSVGDGVRLLAFEIPPDPVNDRWQSTVLNADLNRMHNHWHVDFDQDGLIDTLTASQEGVTLIRRTAEDWQVIRLGNGASGDQPADRGAGEIKVGHLADGQRFIATVEPMHGRSVVVYSAPDTGNTSTQPWQRTVIDTGFQRGHAVWTADVDGDKDDEIVFGHSDTPGTFGIIVYDCTDSDLLNWTQYVVDAGGMATEDLIVADVTGDGRLDIVAGGRATHNVKLYVNSP